MTGRAAVMAALLALAAPVQASPLPGVRVRLAPGATLALPAGRASVSSLLRVPGRMRYGDYAWNETSSGGPVWIRLDLARQIVSVFRGSDEIGTAVILYGADGRSTPRGAFRVLARDRDHRSSTYDAAMPFMLRLTDDGVAIHASDVRAGFATHGCVGVPPGFARLLFEAARRGDRVFVV